GIHSKGGQELRRLSPNRRSRQHSPHSPGTPHHQNEEKGERGTLCESDSPPWNCVVVETRLGVDDEIQTGILEHLRSPADAVAMGIEVNDDDDDDLECEDEETVTLMVRHPDEESQSKSDPALETIDEILED
ncbi:hypothetical protein SK128_022233, partial [Halocaridina rubra]